MKRRLRLTLSIAAAAGCLSAIAACAPAHAAVVDEASRQPLESITARATELLRARHGDDPTLEVSGGRLDARLRLARCGEPLEAALAPGSGDTGRVTVQVRCPVSPGWRVHVPLEVSRERTVWTFARAGRRGEVLGRELLERTTVTLGRESSRVARAGTPVEEIGPWIGYQLARDVPAGQPLVATMLAPRRLIERGAEVRLRVAGAGLAIEATGVALDDASLDERVAIRNSSSGRVVEAIVTGRGTAEIRP